MVSHRSFHVTCMIYYPRFTSNYLASQSNAHLPTGKALYHVSVRQGHTLALRFLQIPPRIGHP